MNPFYTMRKACQPASCAKLAAIFICVAQVATPQAWAQVSESAAAAAPAVATASAPATIKVDSIVAIINEDVITRRELQKRVQATMARMAAQKFTPPPQADLQRQVLERMIYEKTQTLAARDLGIRVDDATLDRSMATIAEQNKLTFAQFREQVEADGTEFADFREQIRNEITISRLREREVNSKILISDSEVDNFLAAEALLAQNKQEYNLGQILVRIPENASSEIITQRRERANEVLQKLNSGADFVKMVGTYSDASDALTGGELGWRSPDRLPQLFFEAIAKLNEGEVSAIIKSPNGFHILKLLGKRKLEDDKKAAQGAVQQTHARHILIKVNQLISSYDARRKLVEVRERLKNKAGTFDELAKLFSTDASASKGGDLGWLYPGDTVPDFEKAMDVLKPGEVSEPIETQYGFHLIEVLERKTDDVSAERKRQAARQVIKARKADENGEEWVRQLRDSAYVEYRLEER
jgi:peptidyl-prolyl cis-trans isomerase SurA